MEYKFQEEEGVIDFEEDFRPAEELTLPKVSSWIGEDGKHVHGVMVINDVRDSPKSKRESGICAICLRSYTCKGNHQICCLPCGHVYGSSCIKNWLLPSVGQCPVCNELCSHKDVRPLSVSPLRVMQESSTRYFPFTKQGFNEFKLNEKRRWRDAQELYLDAKKRMSHVCHMQKITDNQHTELMSRWNDVTQRLGKLKQGARESGQPDALQRRADAFKRNADELEKRRDALEERDLALKRRFEALGERVSQYRPRLNFFVKMYMEMKHILENKKKKKKKPCTTEPSCHKN